MGLQAALEQERAARSASSSEVAAAEAAARAAAAERDARARDLHAVRTALHDTSEKLAAASAERDMNYARVSDAEFLSHFFDAINPPRVSSWSFFPATRVLDFQYDLYFLGSQIKYLSIFNF